MAEPKCAIEGCRMAPVFICNCASNIYICLTHLGSHMLPETSKHQVLDLYAVCDPKTVESVKSFLANHQKELLSLKNTILEKAGCRISKINEVIPEPLKQISNGIKLDQKMLKNLNNLCKIQIDTKDPFYQALLLPGKEAVNKIKPHICKIPDYQNILSKLSAEVDIESIVEKQMVKRFDILLELSLEKTEKMCHDMVKDLEILLKKSIDTKMKTLESKIRENGKEINEIKEIKEKLTDFNADISQRISCIQNFNGSFEQKTDKLEKRLTEIEQQFLNKNTENKKEADEIKAKISDFNGGLSRCINNIQNLNENCKRKVDELEKKLSEKVDSELDKIKYEFNNFLLKKNSCTDISNLVEDISKINKKLSSYETKYQDIENISKTQISKLEKKVTEIEKEFKPKASKIDDKTVLNQTESKKASCLKKDIKSDAKLNTSEKSKTLPNSLLTSSSEKSSLLNNSIGLEIDIAASECSSSNHGNIYHLSGCSKSHCLDCHINYYMERGSLQSNFYCHHGNKLGDYDIRRLEMEIRRKIHSSSNKFLSPRDIKSIDMNSQNFDRNAQTPTVKHIPSYTSSEKSAIPVRASEKLMNNEKDNLLLYSPRSNSRFQRTPSKKLMMSLKEEDNKKG